MEFAAVILAGGRSSRLGGVAKASLVYDGATLLEGALQAARGAGTVVVVGPDPGTLPGGVLSCREDPPFAGPAAAIAAGLSALQRHRAGSGGVAPPLTLVLACDMPRVDAALRVLLEAAGTSSPSGQPLPEAGPPGDGYMAVADGRRQPLVGLYGTTALQRSVDEAERRGMLINASVSGLLASLDVREVTVPSGATDDVDTWDDASALGVSGLIHGHQPGNRSGTSQLTPTLEANGEDPG
ncbi:molybdenum cofactor guanylyltransferase [Arthrobacter sp. CG_A4]|uniref:molybdenum cofactor guanylyltransferase n=1 Tax=Arthrobacter sp. CG_A4 TaxID=3071706 RepID=UPI002E068E43|nr:molybdopterin-guanine dinucleotide biosynthesis protein A [Arthrobacter sp. CG_A4]